MNDQTGNVPDYGSLNERGWQDKFFTSSASEDVKRAVIEKETEVVRSPLLPSDTWGERAANQLDQARLVLRAVRRLVLAAAGVVAAVLFLIAILAPL